MDQAPQQRALALAAGRWHPRAAMLEIEAEIETEIETEIKL